MKANVMKQLAFQGLYEKAMSAGAVAGFAVLPEPMVLQNADILGNKYGPIEVVNEGCCGFAWVIIKGNSGFAKWAKANGFAKPAYGGGLRFWIGGYGQSLERKLAHADAMALLLNEAGIEAYADSRMD